MQAETELTLIFHHGGDFIKFGNADLQYIGGQMCVWERLEADFLNKFDLEAMVKKCGSYFNINHIWYLLPEMNNLDGLREVVNDKDFMEMVSVAKDNNNEIELYFEHGMEVPTIIVPASDEDIDDEPVQNEVDMPEVEVQNDETVVDGDYDAETEVDGDSDVDTNVDGDSDAENANLDAAFNWHNDDGGEVQENIIHQNVIPSSSDEEWNSYHSEELKSPISTDDEGEGKEKEVFPQYTEAEFGQVHLEKGMEFETLKTFKNAVREYNIALGRVFRWVKNDKERVRAKCRQEDCPWEIFCSWSKVNLSFQVKTFETEHSCCRVFKNSQAKTNWVVSKLEMKLRVQPNMTYLEVFDWLKRDFGVHVNETKLFRAMKKAKELVEGSLKEQYGRIWDYAHELTRSNEGSTVKINCIPRPNGPPQFQRIYISLDACKRGFKAGCRPFIGLDGCFLKGYYGGQLLSAVSQDANNHIYVVAYAVVDVENKENWKWFLTLLHEDLGDYRQHGWNFMSDMQKVLIF
jgi:hypothetical protein